MITITTDNGNQRTFSNWLIAKLRKLYGNTGKRLSKPLMKQLVEYSNYCVDWFQQETTFISFIEAYAKQYFDCLDELNTLMLSYGSINVLNNDNDDDKKILQKIIDVESIIQHSYEEFKTVMLALHECLLKIMKKTKATILTDEDIKYYGYHYAIPFASKTIEKLSINHRNLIDNTLIRSTFQSLIPDISDTFIFITYFTDYENIVFSEMLPFYQAHQREWNLKQIIEIDPTMILREDVKAVLYENIEYFNNL